MKLVIFYLHFSHFLILNYFEQSFHSLVMATNINKIDENPNFKIEEHSSIDIQKNVTWPEMLQSMITEKECSSSSVRNNYFSFFFLPYFMDIFFIFIYFYLFSFISIYFHLFLFIFIYFLHFLFSLYLFCLYHLFIFLFIYFYFFICLRIYLF